MTSWLQRQTSSHYVQLAGTAVLSGAAVAGMLLGYQSMKRKAATEELKSSIPSIDEDGAQKVRYPHSFELSSEFTMLTNGSEAHRVWHCGLLETEQGRRAKRCPCAESTARRLRRGCVFDQHLCSYQAVIARCGRANNMLTREGILDLILEQLARNRTFLADDGLAKLRSSFIIVVGCGGVGSHAAAALARSGVGRIRLIDFDQVTLSSLNRHAVATLADVGTPKVHCIRRRLEQIAPWVGFDCRDELFGESAADELLSSWSMPGNEVTRRPDYIIDCIDNISSKVALLHYCHSHDLQVISSMGAGCKSDPTRIAVGDISMSIEDPLSRSTRRQLKILGVSTGIPVVFSTEKPGPGKAQLLPLSDEEITKGEVGELGVLPDFRVRILPVLGTMPAAFGYTIANHIICEVSGYPNEYNPSAKRREKLYDGILGSLQGMEERLARTEAGMDSVGLKMPVTKDDVAYLVEEVWRGKSVVSGLATRLTLIRWQRPSDGFGADLELLKEGQKGVRLPLGDLVCTTKEEAKKHETEILKTGRDPTEYYTREVVQKVEERMREEEVMSKFR